MSAEPPTSLIELESVYQTGADFLERYEATGETGTFFCALARLPGQATVGAVVSVNLRFVDRDADFHVHARVVERQADGLRLAFLAEERSRQELVLTCASGESLPYYRRRHERIPCRLEGRLVTPEGRDLEVTLISISEGGALLALVNPPLEQESGARLSISSPGGEPPPPAVTCRIASVIRQGPQEGVGIEFRFSSAVKRDAMHAWVARFRQRVTGRTDPA
jgi:hypothetical protein